MKIIIVIDLVDMPTNGSVMTALRFAEGLRGRGHTVGLVAIGANGENDCAVKERYVPVLSEVSAKNQVKYGKFDREKIKKAYEGADLVHFIFPFKFEKQCKLLADEMGIPTTAAFHVAPENFTYNMHLGNCRPLVHYIYGMFKRKFYKRFTRIHCPSAAIARQLERHGYNAELYVISNGYDKAFVPPVEKFENKKFEIIMVGRLTPEKNQQVILSAIARSCHKDDFHLTLLGNGSKRKMLEKKAKKLGVDITFGFMGKAELIKTLQQSDLYVHSAKVETEAIACIEAIACGLVPVIADSEYSATPQFALDKRSLFKNNDPQSLAARLDYWYENVTERKKMSGLYAQSAKKYSLDNSMQLTERMFRDQINETKK